MLEKNQMAIMGGQRLAGRALVKNRGVWGSERWEGILQDREADEENSDRGLFQTVINLPENWIISPGFIDIHIHGMAGKDVMDATQDALETIAQALVKTGVTSWLATTMTMQTAKIQTALEVVSAYRKCQNEAADDLGQMKSKLEGVHLEGPYISERFKGAQDATYILPMDIEQFERDFYQIDPTLIKHITCAPEQEGAEAFIQMLRQKGIHIALGHTACTFDEAMAAKEAGATHITHFFNGMPSAHHREPGLAGAGLMTDFSMEWIADNIHVRPEWLKFLLNLKQEKSVLITDAMCAAGLCPGHYELGGQKVITDGASARLENGVLAGSVLTMDQAVRNMAQAADGMLGEILYAASTAASELLKFSEIGRIEIGRYMDFVILDESLTLRAVGVNGNLSYADLPKDCFVDKVRD